MAFGSASAVWIRQRMLEVADDLEDLASETRQPHQRSVMLRHALVLRARVEGLDYRVVDRPAEPA